jgi:hypothetical protein
MAGESAREVARRQREKAERLERSAALYERGALGEQATAAALETLPADWWKVFHDVHWPGRRYANIDHVVVGPGGVFVIDSKNWSGSITVRDNVLRQNGRGRETTVAAAAEAASAIAEITTCLAPHRVQPVLCFVRDEALTGCARDVMVCSTSNLVQMLLSRPHIIDEQRVRQAALELDVSLRAATGPHTPTPGAPRSRTRARRTPSVGSVRPPSKGSRSRKRSASSPIGALVAGGLLLAIFLGGAPLSAAVGEGLARLFTGVSVTDDPVPNDRPTITPGEDAKRKPRP